MQHFVGKHQCLVKHQVVGKHESVGKYESVGMHEDASIRGYVAVHEYGAMLLQVSQQQAWVGRICISAQPHKQCTAYLCAAAAAAAALLYASLWRPCSQYAIELQCSESPLPAKPPYYAGKIAQTHPANRIHRQHCMLLAM